MNQEFILGANYWASNAGTEMWRQWDPEAVENDFKKLSEYGIKYLRVFPNWRDFQPIYPLHGGGATVVDFRLHDADLPTNPYYLDDTMLERFGVFCDLADKYGMKLIVGLLTGWMSGRTFIPPALYGRRLISDAVSLVFQQKMVYGMAKTFKDKPAIYAWDLGNECNVLVYTNDRYEAKNWSIVISNAIRTADSTHPIVSGMHSLKAYGVWRIEDQGEATDILTTHPYPYWCEHCGEAEITSVQTLMHATCETKYYENLGKKPCLVEEMGTTGPMVCNNDIAGDFLKVNLYSNWVNGAPGVMWWCANEQIHLMFPPYDRNMNETELGMFDRDGNARPVLKEFKKFSEWLKKVDFTLPAAVDDAVCLVTDGQDQWGVVYSSYVLAKQAGVNIRFADATKEIPDSEIYLLPSVNGIYVMPSQKYAELKKKVQEGATLYISINGGSLSEFSDLTGLAVKTSHTNTNGGKFKLNGTEVTYNRSRNFTMDLNGAEVIASDENGMPIFTKYKYGKGTVYYLNFPLENNLIGDIDGFDGNQHEVYREIFKNEKEKFAVTYDNKYIGMTRHKDNDAEWITLINYSSEEQSVNMSIKDNRKYEIVKGDIEKIAPFEMTILKIYNKN